MTTQTIAPHGRMHALDGLRAVMMLLGIVLHTGASYVVLDLGDAWVYKDTETTVFADLTLMYIHVFRMPIFFVLAGFFGAMLYFRRGVSGLLNNRVQRIAMPFFVALLVLYPLIVGGAAFTNASKESGLAAAWQAFFGTAGASSTYLPDSTMHLWFIYYLMYFYLLAVGVAWICRRLPESFRQRFTERFRDIVARPVARVLVPGSVTAVTLVPMAGVLQTRTSFVPDVIVLLAYSVFFGFGWLLYREHETVMRFAHRAWTQVIAATVGYFAFQLFALPGMTESENIVGLYVIQPLVNGIVVWMLFFGFTGLFMRYLDRPSARVRYVVDASYWVYLVHLPCTIWIPGLIVGTDLSVWPRIGIVLIGTTFIGFTTYALFVRSTWIGKTLNGRRYSRGLPTDPKGPAAPTAPSAAPGAG